MSAPCASDRFSPEEHFRRLFEEAPLPYQSVDNDGRLLAVNQAWEQFLGYSREDVRGRFIAEFLVPGQEEKLRRAFQAFLDSGTVRGIRFEFQCKNGTRKLATINGRIAVDDNGRFLRTHCILSDITERKRIESALQRSEEKYQLAMDAVQDGLWDWNLTTGHVYYSPGWSRILGDEDSHNDYSTWANRIHPEDKPRILETLHHHLDGNTAEWKEEHRLRHANGSWVWVLGRGRVVERDLDGRPLRMIGTTTDVHERKLAEIALSQSEEKYRLLFNSVDEVIAVFDRNGIFQLLNRRAASCFDSTPEDIVGKSLTELHPGYGDKLVRRIQKVIGSGVSSEHEDEVESPAGMRWLFSRIYPMSNDDGVAQSALIISKDVTDRRLIEEALQESEAKLKALINATTEDAVVLLNADLKMEVVNERAARGFGRTVEQMIECPIGELMHQPIATIREECARKVIGSGQSVRFEDQRAGRWYDNNMCPVFDEHGKTSAVAIFARDITERKNMEEKLAEAKKEAERANAAKSRFLAAANHDLRQPLHALRLLIEAILLHGLEAPVGNMVLDMKDALKSMEGLLNALLDISKLEAGSFQPEKQDFHVVPFLHELRGQFKAAAQDAQAQIRVAASNAILCTDPILLARIVKNFVSNAIRHAHGGSILIGCRRTAHGRRIEVWDNGPGIPPHEQQKIFDEFYQVGNPARTADQGLGLGLSIAKRMAELLKLKIGVRSTKGKGSVFSVEVPIADECERARDPQVNVSALPDSANGLILVVDDDKLVLKATKDLLNTLGYETISAPTAEEALTLAQNNGESLCLALLDYRLSNGWDGIQLSHRLRSELDWELPVILITGDTTVSRLRDVRISELPILHKPIDPDDLRRLIADTLPLQRSR
jgi:PAS domain S-box-containing protein